MSQRPALFTPDGRLIQKDEHLDRAAPRHVTKHVRQWFLGFAAFLTKHALGLHCGLCHLALPQMGHAWRHWGECDGEKPEPDGGIAVPVVKTEIGLSWVTGRTVETVELGPNAVEWFRQAQDVCAHFLLGIHCDKCQADLVGLNADADAVFSTACSCREFLGPNREYRPTSAEVIH